VSYEKKKLKDCCVSISDGDHLPPPKAETGIPFITISNIDGNNQLDFSNVMYVPEEYYDGLPANKKAVVGDILYSVVGSFGKPVYISNNDKFVFQRHIAILKPTDKMDGKYLYYTMLNPMFYRMADKLAIGCAQRTITLDALRNIVVDIPPIEKQKSITNVLNAIDGKIAVNNRINDNLEHQLEDIYNYWFTQFDFAQTNGQPYKSTGGSLVWNEQIKRKIPANWDVKPLGEICSFRNGINYDKNIEGDKTYRIVNVRNISSSAIVLDENDLDEIRLPQRQGDKYCVSSKSIIVARSGIPGAPRVLHKPNDNTIFCGFIICCTPCDKMLQYYLTFYLKQLEGSSATQTGGSILQNVSQDTLSSLLVPVPPKELLNEFNEMVSRAFDIIHNNMNENTRLHDMRDWLLPMLINGQVSVGD